MNYTDDDVYEVVEAYLKLMIDDENYLVIEGNQNGKTPTGPFATMLIITPKSYGMGSTVSVPNEDEPETKSDLHTTSIRDLVVSINFFRDGAHDYAQRLMNFPYTNKSYEFLFDKNVSVFPPTSYNKLDGLMPDGYERRAQLDLRLHCVSEYVETVNTIDDVDVEIVYNP